MKDLVLEIKDQKDGTVILEGESIDPVTKKKKIGTMLMTPAIDESYWTYRVRLSDKQAIVGFPKFSTIGIGSSSEDDWNTNLPYTSPAEEIFEHIKHNKGDDGISNMSCVDAIRMIQQAVKKANGES